MKKYIKKSFWFAAGFWLVAPVYSYSAGYTPGLKSLADEPLYLSGGLKSNLMVIVDDSGSMDWETMFDTPGGLLYLDTDGRFASGGVMNTYGSASYGYLFPNGSSTNYYASSQSSSGGMLLTGWKEIAPIKAYAFARSSEYNKAYYDPNETYTPWPLYGELDSPFEGKITSIPNASVTATRYDPLIPTRTISLFSDFNTSTNGSGWGFYIGRNNMPCEMSTFETCGTTNDKHYTYYPGTYYLKNSTSTYRYYTDVPITISNSQIFEAEDNYSSGTVFRKGAVLNSSGWLSNYSDIAADASKGEFVGTRNQGGSSNSSNSIPPSSNGEVSINVTLTGKVKIWIRRWFPSSNDDSFWINMVGYKNTDFTMPTNSGNWFSSGGEHWNKWFNDHANSYSWDWEEFGSVTLSSPATLRIRHREDGGYIDQILVTTDESITPSGKATYTTGAYVERSCATDVSYSYYEDYISSPNSFVFSDNVVALGPDGACLQQYKITGSDSDTFSNGSTARTGVTVLEEKQNFANWFSFYRRRHQATRGAIGKAFQSVNGIRTGMFTINDAASGSPPAVAMNEMDQTDGVNKFLKDLYNDVGSGSTPLRAALNHAGKQYKNNSTIIQGACQKNFALLFTDGFNNGAISGIGDVDTAEGAPYADETAQENTLADVAMKYYKDNLNASMKAGQVPIDTEACNAIEAGKASPEDCNKNLHMNTYTVGLGSLGKYVFGQDFPGGGGKYMTVKDAYAHPPAWKVDGTTDNESQVDDLYHAAVNGRGEIFSADRPSALGDAIGNAVKSILKKTGASSGVTFNTSSLQTDSVVFAATFSSATWEGDLKAVRLDPKTGDVLGNAWTAKTDLDSRSYTSRLILTYDNDSAADSGGSVGHKGGVVFSADTDSNWSNLTKAQKADLLYGKDLTGLDESQQRALAKPLVDFIRGDTTNEGKSLRDRSSRLGDIINSTPVYVGAPSQGYPDKAPFGVAPGAPASTTVDPYSTFAATTRTPTVYVGSNDGMLHGFNGKESGSGAGEEVLAYIPAKVFSDGAYSGLHYLADPDYGHKSYVDLTPIAADVWIDPAGGSSRSWRTVLVGGLRGGGKGLFALDVTNPANFTAGKADDIVMWEFTDKDDSDLGYITSPPVVAMMNNGKWALIFGNGYNAGSDASTTDDSTKLMILFIEDGADGTWTVGDDYVEIEIDDGTGSLSGGLGGVAVADLDGDRVADRVYAGDTRGNMWAFDVSSSNKSSWKVAYKSGSTPQPLFTAKDSGGKIQPITGAPNLTFHPTDNTGAAPNVVVVFGTGRYLTTEDPSITDVQTFYAVWDHGEKEMTRSDLASRKLTQEVVTIGGKKYWKRLTSSTVTDPWAAPYHGWYMDLDAKTPGGSNIDSEDGERVIDKVYIRGGLAVFSTLVPLDGVGGCQSVGRSWLMVLPIKDGLPPDSPTLDLNNDGLINSTDVISVGKGPTIIDEDGDPDNPQPNKPVCLGNFCYGITEGGEIVKDLVDFGKGSEREGRLGWRELVE
ncbi:pilus assembly protein [Hahella chejuensis]|nr:PilC/PilY family type IV pilus protein [Hahella chejuensis]